MNPKFVLLTFRRILKAIARGHTDLNTTHCKLFSKFKKYGRRLGWCCGVFASGCCRKSFPDLCRCCVPGAAAKRYNCTSCPYQTDRRDLYTRHEAIHLAEKPFHCYACQKQFNRADHVKKHFLRMHRDQPYDLNRIRRTASSKASSPAVTAASLAAATTVVTTTGNGSTMAFYTKFGAASAAALSDPDGVNGVAATSVADEELQLQQLELEQQQLEQQQLQQHELQLQQQELQLQQQQQQQQIILQTQVSRP